jgi:hypothetical protein
MPSLKINGELVVWDPGSHRTSFALLQQRITAAHAISRRVIEHGRDSPGDQSTPHEVGVEPIADLG